MAGGIAQLIAVLGATGSGKTTYIEQRLKKDKPARLLVWTPKEVDFTNIPRANSLAEVARALLAAHPRGKIKLRYVCRLDTAKDEFKRFCKLAYAAGDLTVVADELSFVTTPSKAPSGWLDVCSLGRDRGMIVYAATQRPQECDKTFLDQATLIRCGRLNSGRAKAYLADLLEVPYDQVANLGDLEFIERDTNTRLVTTGKLKFSGKK